MWVIHSRFFHCIWLGVNYTLGARRFSLMVSSFGKVLFLKLIFIHFFTELVERI